MALSVFSVAAVGLDDDKGSMSELHETIREEKVDIWSGKDSLGVGHGETGEG